MNYLSRYLEFDTVEEGKKNLKEVREIQKVMKTDLKKGPLFEDYKEIRNKIKHLKTLKTVGLY